jgi:hypothetical protein
MYTDEPIRGFQLANVYREPVCTQPGAMGRMLFAERELGQHGRGLISAQEKVRVP